MVNDSEDLSKGVLHYYNHQDDLPIACGPLPRRTRANQSGSALTGNRPLLNVATGRRAAYQRNTSPACASDPTHYGLSRSPVLPFSRRRDGQGRLTVSLPNESLSDLGDLVQIRFISDEDQWWTKKACDAVPRLCSDSQNTRRFSRSVAAEEHLTGLPTPSPSADPRQEHSHQDVKRVTIEQQSVEDDESDDDEEEVEPPVEREEVPVHDRDSMFGWLETRFQLMRQEPKKALTPFIINLMNPDKRVSRPYTKSGEITKIRPDYWPPEYICPEFKGPHHTKQDNLKAEMAWFFLLPAMDGKSQVADRCLGKARATCPDKNLYDWACLLEVAVDEFMHKARKDPPPHEQVKAEAKAFRDMCLAVREFLKGIDRDEDDVFTVDKIPRLAQKNKSGKATSRKKKTKAAAKPRKRARGPRILTPTSSTGASPIHGKEYNDGDGSETEEDEEPVANMTELRHYDSLEDSSPKRRKAEQGSFSAMQSSQSNFNSSSGPYGPGAYNTRFSTSNNIVYANLSNDNHGSSSAIVEPAGPNQLMQFFPTYADSVQVSFSSANGGSDEYYSMQNNDHLTGYEEAMSSTYPLWNGMRDLNLRPDMYSFGASSQDAVGSFMDGHGISSTMASFEFSPTGYEHDMGANPYYP